MKYYGMLGFSETIEVRPGVYKSCINEYPYYGDFMRTLSISSSSSDKIIDDIVFKHQISIVADTYFFENYSAIKYLTYAGTKWKISSVEINHPRVIVITGGVYNENENIFTKGF